MVEVLTIIHNGGLVMGMGAVCVVFALVALWPDKAARTIYDYEQEDDQS